MGFLPQLMETAFRIDSIWEKYWGFVWRKLSWKGTNKSLCDLSGRYHAALGKAILGKKQNCAWIGVEVQWCGRDKWEKASSSDPLLWWTLLFPTTSKLLSSVTGYFFTERTSLCKHRPGDLIPCSQKFVTDLERRGVYTTGREAVPANFLGLFHSFLSQTKPGSSPLQAERWMLWVRRAHSKVCRSWGGRAGGAEGTVWGCG